MSDTVKKYYINKLKQDTSLRGLIRLAREWKLSMNPVWSSENSLSSSG